MDRCLKKVLNEEAKITGIFFFMAFFRVGLKHHLINNIK